MVSIIAMRKAGFENQFNNIIHTAGTLKSLWRGRVQNTRMCFCPYMIPAGVVATQSIITFKAHFMRLPLGF